jgi:hypothetical protein
MNGVEPYAYLRDLFTKLANGRKRCFAPTFLLNA